MEAAHKSFADLPDDADEDVVDSAERAFEDATAAHKRAVKRLDDARALEEARKALPVAPTEDTPDVKVVSESTLTYERGSGNTFFRDIAEAKTGLSPDAAERIARHRKEMADRNNRQVVDHQAKVRTCRLDPWAQQRAINTTDGSGGELVPPLWLQSKWVPLQRAGRPVANTLNLQPLPPETDTINLPKVSGGTAVAVQTDGNAVQSTDITTTSVTGAVQTVAGQQDASIQLVDLSIPGIDQVIFDDIARAYATKLDVLALTGTVTNAKGINQLSGVNTVTYTQATPTVANFYPKLADAIQRIHTGRFLPPQVIAMHPSRWAWVLASLDSNNRPLVVPNGDAFNQAAVFEDVASENVVGGMHGLPVVVDASIPITLGAGTNQDQVYAYRADDLYLYESAPRLRVFEEVLSNTLQVRFQIYGYYAIILGRYAASISKIDGTGLVAPTF